MITGFNKQTNELTDYEEKLMNKYFIPILSKKIGKSNAVTSKQMIDGLKKFNIADLTGSRIRKIIQTIRTNNLVVGLIASSNGYYVARTEAELEEWIESIRQRENAMRESRIMAEKTLKHWQQMKQIRMFNE